MNPDINGYFGEYGGTYVNDRLQGILKELNEEFMRAIADLEFEKEFSRLLKNYVGRPSPLYYADRLTTYCKGAKIYFKREDLNHTGSHKINNSLGQAMLARRMGRKKVIAETGAGQHGVATATAAALLGLDCTVFMGRHDMERQKLNVFRMQILGADVVPVSDGDGTLKDATNKALEVYANTPEDIYYVIGSAVGPHPYPVMVRHFQSIIGRELKEQIIAEEERLPDAIVACIGGGSNAIGIFHAFLNDEVALIGVEAAGKGLETGLHSAALNLGQPGVLHGTRSRILTDEQGKVVSAYSISAGLDYPGVGPEHAFLKDSGRVQYPSATDEEALQAFLLVSRLEGVIPALESAHALAYAIKAAAQMTPDQVMVVNISGRGDKDVETVSELI
ncbi:tryptophan synthase subunit beta [Syntrophomonas erecta]